MSQLKACLLLVHVVSEHESGCGHVACAMLRHVAVEGMPAASESMDQESSCGALVKCGGSVRVTILVLSNSECQHEAMFVHMLSDCMAWEERMGRAHTGP